MKKVIAGVGILAIVLLAGAAFFFFFRLLGNGGGGSGEGTSPGISTSKHIEPESDPAENAQIAEIKIEEDKIYFDGELCADENDLKDKITAMGTQKEYCFIHDKAIKATYDQVNAVLLDLKDALDITVHEK